MTYLFWLICIGGIIRWIQDSKKLGSGFAARIINPLVDLMVVMLDILFNPFLTNSSRYGMSM